MLHQDSPPSPQQPASAPQPDVASQNAAAVARQQEIFAKARAALREARGIPAPVEAPKAPPVVAEAAPAPTPPVAPQNPPQVNLDVAETFRREAVRIKAEADARVAAAEAKVRENAELARKKPVEWLKANGMDLDAWQTRLLNGGEMAPHEVLEEKVDARLKAAEDRAAKAEQAVQQYVHTQKREAALSQLTPAIQKEFPLVSHFMGPDAALDALTQASKQAGKVLDPVEFFKGIENRFLEQYKAPLSNPEVAGKLQLSVLKSPQSEVAAESPTTLTNRVTSTVTPPSSRPMTDAERIARGREAIKKLAAAGLL